MPREISELVIRDTPVLEAGESVGSAVRRLVDSGLPALPVHDDRGRFAGVFGEREFMQALFPGYIGKLSGAGFVTRSLEAVIEKRGTCVNEQVRTHMNDEHVEVGEDFSDVQLAEVFLHHRVLIIPVVDKGGAVVGLVTRADFFRALSDKFLAP